MWRSWLAYASGGRVVASSSLVIPTENTDSPLDCQCFSVKIQPILIKIGHSGDFAIQFYANYKIVLLFLHNVIICTKT